MTTLQTHMPLVVYMFGQRSISGFNLVPHVFEQTVDLPLVDAGLVHVLTIH